MWEPLLQWFLEPGLQQIAIVAGIALATGIIIGGWRRQSKEKKGDPSSMTGDKAFFKGIQYILSNDHEHAIEEFTKSVQIDSETIETYLALGNLYRSKGDIARAIRIHQSIILRPNIEPQIRLRALFDLGVDYRKGGFLSRALKAFQEVVEEDPSRVETLDEIERLYEEMKDWENAYATRQKIAKLVDGRHQNILAHHMVELGKIHQKRNELSKAKSCFNKAISVNSECLDAYLHLGDLFFIRKEYKKAISSWKAVVEFAPQFTFLAFRRLEGAYSKMKNLAPVEAFLEECARLDSDAFTHLALARYLFNKDDFDGALREVDSAIELDPSFWEARRFKGEILLSEEKDSEALLAYKDLLEHLNVPYLKFQCTNCGFQPSDLQWQCPQCKKWDTVALIESSEVKMIA